MVKMYLINESEWFKAQILLCTPVAKLVFPYTSTVTMLVLMLLVQQFVTQLPDSPAKPADPISPSRRY